MNLRHQIFGLGLGLAFFGVALPGCGGTAVKVESQSQLPKPVARKTLKNVSRPSLRLAPGEVVFRYA